MAAADVGNYNRPSASDSDAWEAAKAAAAYDPNPYAAVAAVGAATTTIAAEYTVAETAAVDSAPLD